MPRSIWSGAVSFGLVNIPVRLVTAVERKNVSFREIRRGDASRIRHRKVAANTGEEVSREEIVKGYEIGPDRYVVVDPAELKALNPSASRTIEIEDFVDVAEIDPIFFESSYYLLPAGTAAKPYKLLHEAMSQTGRAGVGRFVLRTKQHLAVIRPVGEALAISTVVYADEVVDPSQLEGLPGEDVAVSERELAMATQLIESLSIGWEPHRYRDEYREQVLAMIEAKAEGQDVVAVPDDERTAGDVVDLMAALQASLQAAREDGDSTGGSGDTAESA